MTTAAKGNWLCPTPLDRERLIDMNKRVASARRVQGVSLGLVAAAAAPFLGWWLLILVAVAGLVLLGLERAYQVSRRPELTSVASIGALELIVTAAAAGTGGAHSPMLGWLAVPIVMLAARFPARVVGIGVTAAILCGLSAIGAGNLLGASRHAPSALAFTCWVALLVSLVAAMVALLSAEMQSRGDAVIDPLTGLANRLALATRFEQAAAQAAILDTWVSVIMCDLDHFKTINDAHGHEAGDHVLCAAAYEMRHALRSFDSVYRIGGEEFLVLLPGVMPADALIIADRLRVAVSERVTSGLSVTMSAGVASAHGQAVNTATLTRDADAALYDAKHTGRDRVCVAGALAPVG
jgi:diguanylate cyclase (GGDEF)-like protein